MTSKRSAHTRKLSSGRTTKVREHDFAPGDASHSQRLSWRHGNAHVNGQQTYQMNCWGCGKRVFFYRNDAGSKVFFDDLGAPWPKHGCPAFAEKMQGVLITDGEPVLKKNMQSKAEGVVMDVSAFRKATARYEAKKKKAAMLTKEQRKMLNGHRLDTPKRGPKH